MASPPDWSRKTYEERASYILKCHYDKLSAQLEDPKMIANVLYGGRVIKKSTVSNVEQQSLAEDSRAVLLKAVRNAVSRNHCHLKSFIDALEKAEYDELVEELMKDYRKCAYFKQIVYYCTTFVEHIDRSSYASSRRGSNSKPY